MAVLSIKEGHRDRGGVERSAKTETGRGGRRARLVDAIGRGERKGNLPIDYEVITKVGI